MPRQDCIAGLRRAVGEDPAFQRRVWVIRRTGWVAMADLVLPGLAGSFGDGSFGAAEAAVSQSGRRAVRRSRGCVAAVAPAGHLPWCLPGCTPMRRACCRSGLWRGGGVWSGQLAPGAIKPAEGCR